jgi:acyl-phosphate glycerol 3-phosphate acyltransferase
MPPVPTAGLLLAAVYLVGSIPVGYLVGRACGVDLFREGSGNIGATNVGRVLGRPVGVLVFVLDFLKGAGPVAAIEPLARAIDPGDPDALGLPQALSVGAAAAAFLGHLFPVTLGFRGGKGVATGAGAVAVLVPGPFVAALGSWLVVVLATRCVSLGSLVATGVLVTVRLVCVINPFEESHVAVTAFCLLGSLLVVVKHRTNIRRLVAGTENRIGDSPMRRSLVRTIHVLAVGLWFGGAGFFNFVVAPVIFQSFEEVVATSPSDRTAYVPIKPTDGPLELRADKERNLARALAGAAVGPVFPIYFGMQIVCGFVAVVTAWSWHRADGGRRVHRVRVWVTAFGFVSVMIGAGLSHTVSQLRVARFDLDPEKAKAAADAFTSWHFVSLMLSFVTILLAGISLALAAKLPRDDG